MNIKQPNCVVGYARISVERYIADTNILLSVLRYFESQYAISPYLFFWDMEFSFINKRQGYDNLLAFIDHNPVQKVIVYCFDFFRESALQYQDFVDILSQKNIEVVLVDEGQVIHVEEAGNLLADMVNQSVKAQLSSIHSQNSQKGHERRRNQKKPSVVPFGYVINEQDEIALNLSPYKKTGKTYYEIARELVECFLETESVSQTIADLCDEYGISRIGSRNLDFPRDPKGLKAWLTNPFLQGTLVFLVNDPNRRTEYPNNHEAIITPKEAMKIHQIMERRKVIQKTNILVNPLAGLMVCAGCGSPMRISQSNGHPSNDYHYYVICRGAYSKAKHKPVCCDRRSSYGLEISDVIDAVIRAIVDSSERLHLLQPSDDVDEFVKTPEMVKLENDIRQMEALGLPQLQEVIEQEKTKLEDLIAVTLKQIREDRRACENIQSMIARPRFWQYATPEELKDIFPQFVKKVICDLGRVSVELRF